ncbi:hypothetical protein V6N13_078290 [Hibiscus sabdariffa]|uniref:Uncharacterized protein n=2 Tax=Hibiscus sabdariffa TaxID=183260 RepID=A0ABR2RNL0_9ROSI
MKISTMFNSVSAADKIAHNQDLLTLILLRLPTKSLIKFKCVSKLWRLIISDPDFCLSHTRLHHRHGFLSPTALLLKGDRFTPPSEFSIVPLRHYSKVPFFHYINYSDVKILQSCNGLLLCESYRTSYLVCNPTTKAFRNIYCPSNSCNNFLSRIRVSLAFDPLRSPDYKIISIRESYREPYEDEPVDLNHGVFCNGRIHWCGYGNKSLFFDVEKECIETMAMALPVQMDAREECRYFGESRGVVYLAVTYRMPVCLELDIFEMARDYSQWIWKKRLNLGDAVKVFPELELGCVKYGPGFSGVCMIRSEEEEEPRVVVWADGKIVCFDFREGHGKCCTILGRVSKSGPCILEKMIIYTMIAFMLINTSRTSLVYDICFTKTN